MPAVYASYVVEAYLDAAWENITASVIGRIFASWGIPRNGPISFLAATGTMHFTLKNGDGIYSPNGASPISADWKKGCPVRIVFSYDGLTRAWYGRIDDFEFDASGPRTRGKVTVTAVDWMDKAAKFPLDYPDITLEQRADEVAQDIIDLMPIPPLETEFAEGINTFPVAFDTVTDFTRAMTEFNKLTLSELAHMYVRHGGALGEKLVLENAETRLTATPKTIPVLSTDSGFLLLETGGTDNLLLESGDDLLLDEAQDFESDNSAMSYETSVGDHVINDVLFRYIPKTYTLATGLIFPYVSEARPREDGLGVMTSLSLEAGETKTIFSKWGSFNTSGYFGGYSTFRNNSEQRLLISRPFPTAIYNGAGAPMNATPTFSGADLSADLNMVSLETWFDKFKIVIQNTGVTDGFVIFVLAGITGQTALITCDPDVPVHVQDATSIAENDVQPLQFDQVYQITDDAGTEYANDILLAESSSRTVLNRINLSANSSAYNMLAFMTLDIGDMFPATDTNKGVDGYYFIQNMSFTVDPGGIIFFSLGTRDNYYYPAPLSHPAPQVVSVESETGNGVASINWPHTIAAGDNRLLLVEIAAKGTKSVSAVTYGSQALTLLTTAQLGAGDDDPKIELWYLRSPAVGTATITVTTTANSQLEAGSINFVNVHQFSPFGTFASGSGTGTTASVVAAGAANDLIVDVVSGYAALTVGAGQTSRWSESADGAWRGAGSTEPGGASITMSWTLGTSQKWCIGAVAVKAA
jgi:hypothetical protein